MSRDTPVAIQRGEGAGSAARAALARAKARGNAARPGPMTDVPSFESTRELGGIQPAPGQDTPPAELSEDTLRGLAAAATASEQAASRAASTESEEESPELTLEDLEEVLGVPRRVAVEVEALVYPERSKSTEDRRLDAILARSSALDIGELLTNGLLGQRLVLIPPSGPTNVGLTVTFTTVADGVEVEVDERLATEASNIRRVRVGDSRDKKVDVEMSQREYVRRQNEWALAVHIRSFQGSDWPALVDGTGAISPTAMKQRLERVRQIGSPVFSILTQHLGLFFERVQEQIDVSMLGNG